MEKSSEAQNDGTNMDEIGTSLDLTKIEEGKNLLPPSGIPRETREIREPRKLLVDQIPSKKVPLAVEWINLSYSASEFSYYYYFYDFIFTRIKEPKLILHPMSGRIFPGEMLAVMGNSGSGKSTLLQILAGRIISENLTGQILINGKSVNFSTFRKHSGYVMQHDALIPFLTVRETIYYAAHLSIQQKTYIERETAAEAIIQLLRLQNVQDTIIGDKLNKGLTRGEKRRVSIAVDIVHEPPVIFLDEPTSGTLAVMLGKNLPQYSYRRKLKNILSFELPQYSYSVDSKYIKSWTLYNTFMHIST